MLRSLNEQWLHTLRNLLHDGAVVKPRGKRTVELPQRTVRVDLRYPVLTIPGRKLAYKFMAAEAYWILTGDDTVAGIEPWNSRIAQFSDNGETFFGAYGPRIREQLDYVTAKLKEDADTRQAGFTLWRPNPPVTKDYPCTVAIWALIREGYLNLHVFMRSSDAWLGLPYDVFNFSMLGHLLCARLNQGADFGPMARPGTLYLTAASSHLYEEHWKEAAALLTDPDVATPRSTPFWYYLDEARLLERLKDLRCSVPGDAVRWWEA